MSKTAVSAPDRQMTGPDAEVVETGDMAVPAFSTLDQFPNRIFADSGKCSRLHYVFYPWDEDACRPTVVAYYLSPVWNSCYELISNLFAMVTICPVPGGNEMVVHGSYYMVRVH
jgi:hypothetical protein